MFNSRHPESYSTEYTPQLINPDLSPPKSKIVLDSRALFLRRTFLKWGVRAAFGISLISLAGANAPEVSAAKAQVTAGKPLRNSTQLERDTADPSRKTRREAFQELLRLKQSEASGSSATDPTLDLAPHGGGSAKPKPLIHLEQRPDLGTLIILGLGNGNKPGRDGSNNWGMDSNGHPYVIKNLNGLGERAWFGNGRFIKGYYEAAGRQNKPGAGWTSLVGLDSSRIVCLVNSEDGFIRVYYEQQDGSGRITEGQEFVYTTPPNLTRGVGAINHVVWDLDDNIGLYLNGAPDPFTRFARPNMFNNGADLGMGTAVWPKDSTGIPQHAELVLAQAIRIR